jgi:hypothetical protein
MFRSKIEFMKRILIFLFVLLGVSMGSESKEADVFLRFHCQIGEKPGVPRYSIEIDGSKFKVRKSIPILNTVEIEAKGTLRNVDRETLRAIINKLPVTSERANASLSGGFSVKASLPGLSREFVGDSAKEASALSPLLSWIASLHQNYPGLNAIHPITPGDEYKATY